jgi:hypothetical protein
MMLAYLKPGRFRFQLRPDELLENDISLYLNTTHQRQHITPIDTAHLRFRREKVAPFLSIFHTSYEAKAGQDLIPKCTVSQ